MKIAILTHKPNPISIRRFTDAAHQHGHEIIFIHLSYCYMNISSTNPAVYYRNDESILGVDAIIPRINPIHTFYGTAVLRQFEMMRVYSLNSALSITWSRDKLRALQLLARKKLPMPITGYADSPEETEKLIDVVGGAPLIIRLSEGTEGKGLIFAETPQAAVSVINAFKHLKTHILVQEYIQEAKGTDIRCVVIGNKVITAIQRNTLAEDQPHLSAIPIEITEAEKKIAVKAAKALKLNFATIDFLRSDRGPLILDIDCSPRIEMLEKITGCDILSALIQFIQENIKKPG